MTFPPTNGTINQGKCIVQSSCFRCVEHTDVSGAKPICVSPQAKKKVSPQRKVRYLIFFSRYCVRMAKYCCAKYLQITNCRKRNLPQLRGLSESLNFLPGENVECNKSALESLRLRGDKWSLKWEAKSVMHGGASSAQNS